MASIFFPFGNHDKSRRINLGEAISCSNSPLSLSSLIPIAEAAKCGLKVFCPLTTAMQDFGRTIDAVVLDCNMTYHNSWDSMRASMSNHKANADIIVSNMGEYDGSEISKKACSIYSIDKFVSDLMQEFVMVGRPNLS